MNSRQRQKGGEQGALIHVPINNNMAEVPVQDGPKKENENNGKKNGEKDPDPKIFETDSLKILNGGISFNQTFQLLMDLPANKVISPVLEISLFHYPRGTKSQYASGSINIREALAWFYGEEDNEDYKRRWDNFFKIKKGPKLDEEKDQPSKLKVPKVKAENQLLFLDDLIYELPTGEQFISKRNQKSKLEKIIFEEDNKNGAQGNNIDVQKEESEDEDFKRFEDEQFDDPDLDNLTKDQRKKVVKSLRNRNLIENDDIGLKNIDDKSKDYDGNKSQYIDNAHDSSGINMQISISKADPSKLDESIKDQFNYDLQADGGSEDNKSAKVIHKLELKDDDDEIKSLFAEISQKNLKYEELFVAPRAEAKKEEIKFKIKKSKKSLFSNFSIAKGLSFFFKQEKPIKYLDFDTDEDEDYSDVPEYLKDRPEYQDDLEEELFKKKKSIIQKFSLSRGNQRSEEALFASYLGKTCSYDKVAIFKCIFVREEKELVPISKIRNFLSDQLRLRKYLVRVYILKGVGIIPLDAKDDVEVELEVVLNDMKPLVISSLKMNEDGNIGKNPEFYRTYEYADVPLPGSAFLKINMMGKKAIGGSDLIGSTSIDLEDRLYMPEWTMLEKKPVEKRNIEHPARGSRGRLEMWIDILKPIEKGPATLIYPKIQLPYELRVVVWEAKECVFKDTTTECNDLFARGRVKRSDQWKETDTHWFCRQTGSFNWRWKWEIKLPVDINKNYGEDKFTFQLWDRDLIGSNELIGETEIDLHKHKMLSKAFVRRKPVQMRMKIDGTGQETNQMWFDVTHPLAVDEDGNKVSQGKALLSFECLPMEDTEKFENGIGRENPNFHPTLPDPVGRFQFDIFSPLQMLKTILGPKLYRKICCILWCLIFIFILIFLAYYTVPSYFGAKVSAIF